MSTKKSANKNSKITTPVQSKFNKWLLVALVILTISVYYQSLNNKFVSTWDDNKYILENNEIKTFHGDSLRSTFKKIFTSNVAGNYHPLTMLSYAIEYRIFKLNPKPYHVTNLIFHLLNALLVFYFIWLLTRRQWVAFLTALLFAIHPMHVESVAWVSERKDVLYSFFYLSVLCVYLIFIKDGKRKGQLYGLMLFLFIGSLLSKGMAVSLPVLLFVIDYYKERKITRTTLLEKLPFFLIAAVFGYVAIHAQSSADAMDDISTIAINFTDKLLFTSYGIIMYLWKLVAPLNLSCHYAYPVKQDGSYPAIFYLMPIIVLALAFLIYISKRFGKDIIFGFGFFIVTIALVLQFVPVGDAIIADRYSYLPYIGLFFILAQLVNKTLEDKQGNYKSWKIPAVIGITIFSIFFFYLTSQRCKVWQDDFTLWGDVISKFKDDPVPHNSLGTKYFKLKQYDNAITEFDRAIQLNYPHSYYNRGLAYYNIKKSKEALEDFSKAIERNPSFAKGYSMRAMIYTDENNFDAALSDYSKAIQYQPDNSIPYNNRGILYKKNNRRPEAIENFNAAIQLKPDYAEAYNNRGVVYRSLHKDDEALIDFNMAIQIQPDMSRPYYYRGLLEYDKGNKEAACQDLQKASGLGFQLAIDSYNSLCR